MNFPTAPDTAVERIEYVLAVSGEAGGSATFAFTNTAANQIGVTPEELADLFEDYMLAVKAAAETAKPVGATVNLSRQYAGSAAVSVPL